MKGVWNTVLSIAVVLVGLSAIYFWLAVIEEFGFIVFLGVTVLSWILNLVVGEVNTEVEPERRKLYDKVVDTIKSVVGFFAYSTLAAATLVVLYHLFNMGVYLYGQFTDLLSNSLEAYRLF